MLHTLPPLSRHEERPNILVIGPSLPALLTGEGNLLSGATWLLCLLCFPEGMHSEMKPKLGGYTLGITLSFALT